MDLIVLDKFADKLVTSASQFGFKRSHSTVLCSAVLKEIVKYYTDRNSTVYGVFLDASKAFDKVHYGKLFDLLLERGIPPIVVRMLFDQYTRQSASVHWNGKRSKTFELHNGVKQGGILSPVLFTVYFDCLLCRLKSAGIGCQMGNCFAGALCYADDVTILCPSLRGLNIMLKTCLSFAEEFSVVFNPMKTAAVSFGVQLGDVDGFAALGGNHLAWVHEVKHLGNIISSNLSDAGDCVYKKGQFIGSFNRLMANFGFLSFPVRVRLFNSFCSSFYGSPMWRMDEKPSIVHAAWNIAVRRLLDLSRTTHTWPSA